MQATPHFKPSRNSIVDGKIQSPRRQVRHKNDYGEAIVALISDTIRGWDARTVTDKLESAVGRDLQYIRINGTLIGGLVGLIIHAGTRAF